MQNRDLTCAHSALLAMKQLIRARRSSGNFAGLRRWDAGSSLPLWAPKLSGLAEGGINQGAADAAHPEEDEKEPAAVGAGAKKTPTDAPKRSAVAGRHGRSC